MTASKIQLRTMQLSDYSRVYKLWQQSEGVQLRDADSFDAIARYLERNPAVSFVAEINQQLVGTVLGGHDGRRGYLHHLAVDSAFRRRSIASILVDAALHALRLQGIDKTHVMVQASNADAVLFWHSCDFKERGDIILMSHTTQGLTNS